MKVRVVMCLVAGLVLPLSAASGRSSDPMHGLWLTENRKAIVQIAPCGDESCGRTVWVENAVDGQGRPKRDEKNADAAKRDRPICGLELVGGLHPQGQGTWAEGWLYNPRNGSTYSAQLRALSPQELEVRGYLGVSLLGQSQVWTRVADDRGGCPG